MSQHTYRRRFGDRKEGRLVRSIAPLYKFMPYIMKSRNDASNLYADTTEVTETDRWFREKRAEGFKGLGMLHLFIAAYIRTVAHKPGLNRFISGQKIYSRNKITISMVVKRNLASDSNETSIKVDFSPRDTIYDVYRKLNEKIDEIKASEDENDAEKIAASFSKLPGLVFRFAVWLLFLLDYFDLLPKAILKASPFHGSMMITDLGSLGINPIYHHLYNFGNLPVFISFGAKRRAIEVSDEGRLVERKYVDYKLFLDERICDGFYYASALKYIKYYLRNPAALENPPESVEEDIF